MPRRDRQSRKSVSGSMILHGKHLIKAWTKQQSIVATSTAEAELYAGNRADWSSGVCQRPGREKIPSETNSSDLGTKHLISERSEMLMKRVNCFHV